MKPASPLSLFLFLALTTALPIPLQGEETCTAHGTCVAASGRPTFKSIAALWHFSSRNPGALLPHILSIDSNLAQDREHAQSAPSSASSVSNPTDDPTVALSSDTPLSSVYLLSLDKDDKNSAMSNSHASAHPESKIVSVAVPYYGAGSTLRYEPKDGVEGERERLSPTDFEEGMWDAKRARFYGGRECSDVIVVAIVLLFLIAVMIVEVMEGVVENVKSYFALGEGKIRLDEKVELKPVAPTFQLQPAPKTRKFMGVSVVEEAA